MAKQLQSLTHSPSPDSVGSFLAAARSPSRENSYQLFSNTLRPLRYLPEGAFGRDPSTALRFAQDVKNALLQDAHDILFLIPAKPIKHRPSDEGRIAFDF